MSFTLTIEDVARAEAEETGNDTLTAETTTTNRQLVSGTYRGTDATMQLELRVDLDGTRPMKRISGDLFKVSGGTVTYFASFVVNAPALQITPTLVTATGIGTFTNNSPTPWVTVKIRRVAQGAALAPATITFANAANASGASMTCTFASRAFRVVQWEQDSIEHTTPFVDYDVASLPSGGAARVLDVPRAYAEAGIEVQIAGTPNVFADESNGGTWSDAELHASMVRHFSLFSDTPQWRVWLLVATAYDRPDIRGIMFDQIGPQRQGCAIFDRLVGGTSNDQKRRALRTYVHELGHCFNLLHSWQKSFANPPQPNRPNSLSYMNYPQNFQPNEAAYWSAFPFQFDDPEIVHLRHGFRNDVIMGGSDFAIGAADIDELMVSRPVIDNSGLELRIEGKTRNPNAPDAIQRYALSEPVVIELRLAAYDTRGRQVHANIHPDYGFVRVIVRQPDGRITAFRPYAERCIENSFVTLLPDKPMHTSAYIGYGRDGFVFRQPGFYDIRAIYVAPDGSDVVSNVLKMRVVSPRNDEDDAIADLYFGDDQGKLFTFIGSDALGSGQRAFNEVIERYGTHPLAAYAHLANGINATRRFKTVVDDKVVARDAKPAEAVAALTAAKNARRMLDNRTANKAMRELAVAQAHAGNTRAAQSTLKEMVNYFESQHLKEPVLATIREQAKATEARFKE